MANPNPSPDTRFQPGASGNPGGKTAEHKRLEMEAAEMSARFRHAALSRMQEMLEADQLKAEDLVKDGFLRLFKDSEDRAHGTPRQAVDLSNSDGSLKMPREVILKGPDDAGHTEDTA